MDFDDALDWLLSNLRNGASFCDRGFIRKFDFTGEYYLEMHEWIISVSGVISDQIIEDTIEIVIWNDPLSDAA